MIEQIELGSAPWDEECVQVTSHEDYMPQMVTEVNRYVILLRQRFPQAAEKGVVIRAKHFPHDFGGYKEAIAVFNGDDEEASEYAMFMEGQTPALWRDSEEVFFHTQIQEKETSLPCPTL